MIKYNKNNGNILEFHNMWNTEVQYCVHRISWLVYYIHRIPWLVWKYDI